jgi:DNA-binding beta-propeller fold protein YncE
MRVRNLVSYLSFGVLAIPLIVSAGCGGGTSANVVTITVSPPSATVIVSQSLTITATVSGSSNTNISSWTCQYATTTVDSSGKQSTGNLQTCTSATGNIPANSTATTVTFTAPNQVPDPTKLPGNNCTSTEESCTLAITVTATAAADTKKTNTCTISLDSGILVTLTPTTATVPTGEEQQFLATLTNDLQNKGVKWLLTQSSPTTTVPYSALPTCSPGCGSIDANGLYTSPSTVPTSCTPPPASGASCTPADVTIVATSNADTTRVATGTITIITGGPITFNGISPTIAPQGATFYDIYFDAPFISSASTISLTSKATGAVTTYTSASGQVTVLFPIPTSTTPNPASTGARLRLLEKDLAAADTYTVSVSDPVETVTQSPTGNFSFTVVPVRPTSVVSIPDSVPQNGSSNELKLTIDGGYFGPSGQLALSTFAGNLIPQDSDVPSSARQLNLAFPTSAVNSAKPGLYSLSVSRTSPPLPSPNNPSITDLAIFPDYSMSQPSVNGSVGAGTNPSAIDIDQRLGIAAVAETGSNLVQFFSIGTGALNPLPCPVASCAVNVPSGLSVDATNHTVAVVSYQDQTVSVLPLPGVASAPGTPFTISLAGLIPSDVTPLPLPYSIGVDPDTNKALVAYSSSANPTTAKVGFILDLNADPNLTAHPCLDGTTQTLPCVSGQVTLNTGPYPQIAMVPHAHMAYVTPGGVGTLNGVDVTKSSTPCSTSSTQLSNPLPTSCTISSVSLTSGLVTVTTTAPHGLNPGNPGTVLIENVPPGASHQTDFNGAFTILSVINATSFTYALNSTNLPNDTATGVTSNCSAANPCSTAFYSSPNITVGISATTQGIAINPIAQTAALADADATGDNGPQIDLLNSLDQSVTSISFFAGCTVYTTSCPNAPELLGTADVAFQPYTNALVSYNPQQNQVSVSNPVTLGRYAILQTGGPNGGIATVNATINGSTVPLNLFGGVAVDAATNQALVVQSGSGMIQIVNLGPASSNSLKAAQITELQVPTVANALIGGIAGAQFPQGTLTSTSNLTGIQIFGSGFDASTTVRLDGTALPAADVQYVSSRQLTLTIPASFLSMPHRYAVDVINGSGVQSNATDFFVIKAVDMSAACTPAPNGGARPSSVAIVDQFATQPFAPIAVVSNSNCNNISIVDINPQSPTFGTVESSIAVGTDPQGIAVSPRFGLAVVANNGDGTASIINLLTKIQAVPAVTTGTNPTGVAIDEGTGAALVANTGSNTVSEINLALLTGSSPATSLTATSIATDEEPISIAIDPDRGTNNQGLAVVTAVQLVSGAAATGALDAIDIGTSVPSKSTTVSTGSTIATPTGIVFDPSVSPALFYATSSGGNVISAYDPDTGNVSTVHVGINPTSLALNPQTGAILTINSTSNTISIVDTLSNPFKTRRTFSLGGSPQFGAAIDPLTNLAVIADQANNRILLFPMPN